MASEAVCGFCGAKGKSLLRCSRCKNSFYCDKEHQRKHWKQHKVSCGKAGEGADGKAAGKKKTSKTPSESAGSDDHAKPEAVVEPHKRSEKKEGAGGETTPAPQAVDTCGPALPSPTDPSPVPGGSADEAFDGAAPPKGTPSQKYAPVVDTENGEDVQDFLDAEVRLAKELEEAKTKWGNEDPRTIQIYFQFFDVLIAMYRLEQLDKLLDEMLPICQQSNPIDYAKAIQMQAFLRYKQFRFKDSLANFLKFQQLMGPSAELSENIGHTYNAMGNYAMAEASFQDSLKLMDEHKKGHNNKGGVLLGLGTVRQKQKKHEDALPILNQALTFYLERFKGQDHSLIAKARMGVASALQSLERYEEALGHIKEAVRLFIKTCSYESPLTANAMCRLATVLLLQNNYDQAQPFLYSALKLHVSYDTLNLPSILVLVQQILDVHAKRGGDPLQQEQYQQYVPLIEEARKNIIAQGLKEKDDGTVAVFYKTSSELCLLAGAYQTAQPMILDSLSFFRTVRDLDVSNLIEICESMLVYVVKRIGAGSDVAQSAGTGTATAAGPAADSASSSSSQATSGSSSSSSTKDSESDMYSND